MGTRDRIVETIRTGDTDAVNALVDDLEGVDAAERLRRFDDCFDALLDEYEDGDGYQRQSIVRVLDAMQPAFSVGRVRDEADDAEDHDPGDVLDRAEAFYLAALRDDDGRVRIAARRALKQLCVGLHSLGDDDAVEWVVAELEELRDELDDERAKHVEEARDEIAFFQQSMPPELLDAVRDALEDA